MKLVTYRYQGRRAVGILTGEGSVAEVKLQPHAGMLDLIERHADSIAPSGLSFEGNMPLDTIVLEAPIPVPRRNIICVGKNYREHAVEFTRSGFDATTLHSASPTPDVPVIFTKAPSAVIASEADIVYPTGLSEKVDYEAELAVVIGMGGRGIPRKNAMKHVFGFTIINDVTARDLQYRHKQWFLGKSLDSFCPMGPCIVLRDNFDLDAASIRCWVNGELRQSATLGEMIFGVEDLIAVISSVMTLHPGDVIATGTPAGVGIGFDPPKFLFPGDVVTIEISGIGVLTNRVTEGQAIEQSTRDLCVSA